MKKTKIIFYILAGVIFLYFILGERFIKDKNTVPVKFQTWEAGWERVMDDGSRIPVHLPDECEAERKEWVVIERILPENLEDGDCICVRASQQDAEILVDGDLRTRYSTKDKRMYGKNSMSAYVFADLSKEDAGKTVTVKTVSDSRYSGTLNVVFYGTMTGIWTHLFRLYSPGIVIALCAVFLGFLAVLISMIIQMIYHRPVALKYLGWGVLMIALWSLAENKLRQFIVPNNTVIATVAFMLATVIPIPFLLYFDEMQNQRYHKCYTLLCSSCCIVFIVNLILQFYDILDFLDTVWISNVMIALTILTLSISIINDCIHKRMGDYKLSISVFVVLFLAGGVENALIYVNLYQGQGIIVSLGLIAALMIASFSTGKEVRKLEEERRLALATNQLKSEFLIEVSQKIRNPIHAILGMNEKILKEEKDEKVREYAVGVRRTGYTIQNMLDEIFDFSLVDVGKLTMVEDYYPTGILLQDIANETRLKCQEKNLNFELQVSEKLPEVLYGDAIRMQQILLRILHTAVKYTEEGFVKLSVGGKTTEKQQFCLEMEIEDTGMGLKDSDVAKLYSDFADYKNRYSDEDELGLGLSISKSLIEKMNGKFNVQSVYGRGTKFMIEIPQGTKEEKGEQDDAAAEDSGSRILIDREKAMAYRGNDEKMCRRVLQMYNQKALEHAQQIQQAVEQKDYKQYQLILHAMKSSALAIAADRLCELIVQQEKLVKSGNEALLLAKHEEFYQYFTDVQDKVQELLQQDEPD